MAPLPPDLSELGDDLTGAVARALDARRRRRALLIRLAATATAGVIALAALSPAVLGPALLTRAPLVAAPTSDSALADVGVPRGCDQPRGSRFGLPACGHTDAAQPEPLPPLPVPHRTYPSRI